MSDTTGIPRWLTWVAAFGSFFSTMHGWPTPWPPRTRSWFDPVRTASDRQRP